MAFQTGTITNSFELVDKIYGFLLGIGWEHVSTLKTNEQGDGYDFVFKSSSELGTRDVYIRVASGMTDAPRSVLGDFQHPYSDGYTEFVNGLAYQYFPTGGTESQGVNELGIYGPVMYIYDELNTEHYEVNLWKSSSITSADRQRFNSDSDSSINNLSAGLAVSDAKRFVFASEGESTGGSEKLDLYDKTTSTLPGSGAGTAISQGCYITDKDGKGYIYYQIDNIFDHDSRWQYFSADDNNFNINLGDVLDHPPWGSPERGYGYNVTVPRRKRIKINGLDHFRLIHASQGFQTDDLAIYNIDTNTWTSLLTPSVNLGSSSSGLISRNPYACIVTKEMSGYDKDRLYTTRGGLTSTFYSVALEEDGYFSTDGWTSHASTPDTQSTANKIWYFNGYIYFHPSETSDNVYRWQLPNNPTDSGSWEDLGTFFQIDIGGGNGMMTDIHHHLCNRVRVSEFDTNTYWLFADLDRLVVVVKDSTGRYTYLYTGLYEPYASPVVTSLTSSTTADAISIDVDNPDIFQVGQKYIIMDNTGATTTISSPLGGNLDMGPSELFTVLSKSGPTLTISKLRHAYSAGSLVGEDPLPLMVRVHGMERAQTLNNINKVDDDDFSDIAWQYYILRPSVSNAFANTTDVEERSLGTFLHGIVLMDEGDTYTGKEVRGQLKGVYACGTGISNESTIDVGSQQYLAFDISDSGETQRIVVGPI